eukprot:Hpha_TRINITY_DN16866_c0_g1::TRINITY_DN16866_c0_g1_i1::g.150378::m.150378
MVSEMCVATDLDGAKRNVLFQFTGGSPGWSELVSATESFYSAEATVGAPGAYRVDHYLFWDTQNGRWSDLQSLSQLSPEGSQLYCFRKGVPPGGESQGLIPGAERVFRWSVGTVPPSTCGQQPALPAANSALYRVANAEKHRTADFSQHPQHHHRRHRPTSGWDQNAKRPVCPTPVRLCSVCNRGERELQSWRQQRNSVEILGTFAQMMGAVIRTLWGAAGPQRQDLKILSLSDGVSDDTQPDTQAKYVPTSVLLCHSFMTEHGNWNEGGRRVRIYGGDMRNGLTRWWQRQGFPWPTPQWLEHRFLSLDNGRDFRGQLYTEQQCESNTTFDVVLMRHGLCFCDDPSKLSQSWPAEVEVRSEHSTTLHGVYTLHNQLVEARPAYRKGQYLLQWCPQQLEWAVLDENNGVWAYAKADVGHPVLARGPWTVWNGSAHVTDAAFGVDLAPHHPPPAWARPPNMRVCCSGMRGDAESLHALYERAASVLDPTQPNAFALLHGAWTNGTRTEVGALHREVEEAARFFNCAGPRRFDGLSATALWRSAAKEYWLQCDGVIIYKPGGAADPFVQ